jgi:hypothetical protein
MKFTGITLLLLFLLLASGVSADYNFYLQYGNDQGQQRNILGNAAATFTQTTPSTSTSGSLTEPVVYDMNADGINELFLQSSNGVLTVYEGDSLNGPKDQLQLGDLEISPVICDINNDGTSDYIGIFNFGTNDTIQVLNVNAQTQIVSLANKNTNSTNVYGNIACGRFYNAQGNTNYYAFWLDNNHNIHQISMSGSTITETINPGTLAAAGLNTKESSSNYTITYGDHQVIMDDNFDNNNNAALLFMAGKSLIEYDSDDNVNTIDIHQYLDPVIAAESLSNSIKLLGKIHSGGTKNGIVVYTGSSAVINNYAQRLLMLHQAKSFFTGRALVVNGNQTIVHPLLGSSGITVLSAAVNSINNDGIDDIYAVLESNGTSSSDRYAAIRIFSTNNMSLVNNGTLKLRGSDNHFSGNKKFYLADIDDDGVKDIVYPNLDGVAGGLNVTYMNIPRYFNSTYASPSSGVNGAFNIATITSTVFPGIYAPVLVDIDKDGLLDMLFTSPAITMFFMSSATSTLGNHYPFTVINNNTVDLFSYQKITVGYNNTAQVYNYALSCDIGDSTIWNEHLRLGYNFTAQNTTLNVEPPEEFLTFNGLVFTINATFPQFDLYKTANAGIRDYSSIKLTYSSTADNVLYMLVYGSDMQITDYLVFNKTSNNVQISKVIPGSTPINFANATIVAGQSDINLVLIPALDAGSNIQYFSTNLYYRNVSKGTTTTFQYGGTDIKDIELYSESAGDITVRNLGVFTTHDPQPAFVQFQNGQVITTNGVTITNPAPSSSIAGEGFTVLADNNEAFYSVCEYPDNGTYTQRHYISSTNTIDYSNYHDLTVTVKEGTASGDGTGSASMSTGDAGTDILNSLADRFGIGATTKFFLWLLFSLVLGGGIAVGLFKTSEHMGALATVLGAIGFVGMMIVGVFVGWVPFWFIIIVVVLCAGIVAMFFRNNTSGS